MYIIYSTFCAINSLESQIPSGGEAGQVWTSDGAGAGKWADAPSGIIKTTIANSSHTFKADDWLPGDYFAATWMRISVSSNTIEFNNIVGWFIKSYNNKLYFRFSASNVYDYSTSKTLLIVDGTLEINDNSIVANSLNYVTGNSTSIVSKSSVNIINWYKAAFIHLR